MKVTTFRRFVLKWAPDSFYLLINFEVHSFERKFMGVESREFNININEFKRRGQHEKHAVGTWALRFISKLARGRRKPE
jgi:hypothetical protein